MCDVFASNENYECSVRPYLRKTSHIRMQLHQYLPVLLQLCRTIKFTEERIFQRDCKHSDDFGCVVRKFFKGIEMFCSLYLSQNVRPDRWAYFLIVRCARSLQQGRWAPLFTGGVATDVIWVKKKESNTNKMNRDKRWSLEARRLLVSMARLQCKPIN